MLWKFIDAVLITFVDTVLTTFFGTFGDTLSAALTILSDVSIESPTILPQYWSCSQVHIARFKIYIFLYIFCSFVFLHSQWQLLIFHFHSIKLFYFIFFLSFFHFSTILFGTHILMDRSLSSHLFTRINSKWVMM